jgi:hypothetical protein
MAVSALSCGITVVGSSRLLKPVSSGVHHRKTKQLNFDDFVGPTRWYLGPIASGIRMGGDNGDRIIITGMNGNHHVSGLVGFFVLDGSALQNDGIQDWFTIEKNSNNDFSVGGFRNIGWWWFYDWR